MSIRSPKKLIEVALPLDDINAVMGVDFVMKDGVVHKSQ